jgi:cysteinyl-tRNA synthetase
VNIKDWLLKNQIENKMKLLDTLSKVEQEVDVSKKVKIYLCGVTVYDESHIGHARTIIVFDVLRKYLESKGIGIEFIQNFTDVDDKIINRANKENKTAEEISTKYIENYFTDFDGLNVKRATNYPKATEHIEDIIKFIEKLIVKGISYPTKNGVYFSVSKFPEYGKLSKKKIDELQSGSRVEIDEEKKDPLDFAVWKLSDKQPTWDSPWGKGRPGWHIECSAMSIKYLGENFDIHGGGRDLIFPHHENEIAQSESCTGVQFAKIWMHVGMVTIDGEKMSKSIGNVKSIKHVIENWGPNIIRLFCLSGHYSKPIDYSEELLKENLTKWRQVETCHYELIHANNETGDKIDEIVTKIGIEFDTALNNDFNTHLALSAFFQLVKETNRLAAEEKLGLKNSKAIKGELKRMLKILGLKIPEITDNQKEEIDNLIIDREKARNEKQFEDADKIRDKLNEMNIELIDHKEKTIWMRKENIRAEK